MASEDIKDTQKTDKSLRLLDQTSLRVNPFGENRAAERVYRRAERIAAGVYMLTAHISDTEPIRARARASANSLIASCLALRDHMRPSSSSSVHDVLSEIRYQVSIMRLLAVGGFVSDANAGVVIEALDELGNFIHASQRSILSENVSLTKDDLIDVRSVTFKPTSNSAKDMSDKAYVRQESAPSPIKDMSDIRQDSPRSGESVRVQSILEILRSGGSLGIKDIATNLPEYSEKMIQRELLDLVSRGAVKKTGHKRWSRYSAAA